MIPVEEARTRILAGIAATSAIVASTAVQIYLIGTLTLVGLAILAITSLVSTIRSARHR